MFAAGPPFARVARSGIAGSTGEGVAPKVSPEMNAMTEKTIDKLNEFLRGELSAVETYNLALGKTAHTELTSALEGLRDDHAARVGTLRQRILAEGGEPSETSGAWGAFARVVQAGADVLGNAVAIAALEEGEDHGLKLYREALADSELIEPSFKHFVSEVLLPAQEKSHATCRSLKRFVKAAA
jgi:demethoxyubiquinone hydroxylase (CLK1/Coq7/Cat5 family)